jgi:hypothetical protein
MDIGCQLPMAPTREALTTFAREAEQRRVASLWVLDLLAAKIRPAVDAG